MSDELKFSVDSLLISELGERLVTRNHVAMAELIKNAYDADAFKVEVKLINAKKETSEKSCIIISDNGDGMTFDQINANWMRIATPNKIRNPISMKYGRPKTGDKGVGRFACDRLAKRLVLTSTAELGPNQKERTTVTFEWSDFSPGQTLTEVPNHFEKRIVDNNSKVGTILSLEDLREAWTQRDFNVLRRQILSLSIVTPAKRVHDSGVVVEDPGFKVVFDAPEFEMGTGELSDQVMNAGWGRLSGTVRDDGKVELKLEALQLGKKLYELPETYAELSGISFDVALIYRNKEYLRDTKTLTMQIVDEIFENYCGIRVYLEGFRVYPYGEPGNDWLDIDKDVSRRMKPVSEIFERLSQSLVGVDPETAMLKHPSNRNLFGGVQIKNKPKLFQVALSREGFIENVAFEKMKQLIRRALEWETLYYNSFVYQYESSRFKEKIENFEDLRSRKKFDYFEVDKETGAKKKKKEKRIIKKIEYDAIDSAINVVSAVSEESSELLPEKEKIEAREFTSSALQVIDESVSQMRREINFLRLVASSGSLMWTLIHESRVLVAKLDSIANSLEIFSGDLDENRKKSLSDIISSLRKTSDRFDKQFLLLSKIGAEVSLTERSMISLAEMVNEVLDCYSTLTGDYNINVEKAIPLGLKVGPIFEVELYSVIVNLVSNAIKSVIAGDGGRIKIEAVRVLDGSIVRVYDDGIGVSEEMKQLATEAFVSDPEGKLYGKLKEKLKYDHMAAVGEGSGMGLNIVKNILSQYGKGFHFVDVSKPWKACAEVSLP